jgi:hypothetical protein
MTQWRILAAASTSFLIGCASDPPAEPAPQVFPGEQVCPADRSCDFMMDLGVGLDEFSPVHAGDDIAVILGMQGGFHIWLAARCEECSRQVLIEYGVRGSADGAWLNGQPLRGIVNLEEVDGWGQMTGLYGLLPGTPTTVDYVGLTLTLEVKIEYGDKSATRVVPVRISNIEEGGCPDGDIEGCH